MTLQSVSGAGKGWFAARAIPPGTVLLLERGLHSSPYLPSQPQTRAHALDDLTRQLCEAGAAFGWWTFTTKLNLALAAGLALPLLQVLGYQPGQASPAGLQALSWLYGGLPCLLKALAALALWTLWMRTEHDA